MGPTGVLASVNFSHFGKLGVFGSLELAKFLGICLVLQVLLTVADFCVNCLMHKLLLAIALMMLEGDKLCTTLLCVL